MKRPILVCALLLTTTAALGAQEANESSPYQGTSTPPPDTTIETSTTPQAKPLAGRKATDGQYPVRLEAQAQTKAPVHAQPDYTYPASNDLDPDSGIVGVQRDATSQRQPGLIHRSYTDDPDGDIVHPHPPRPGELPEGTTIRVRLLDRLSTVSSEKGETFHSRVASDVMQGDQVLIPAGAEIDGRVVGISTGHVGGHGSMHLLPETVILANGTRYHLRAVITGTPGARTKTGSEGTILPASRLKRDGIEYGGAVGAGAATGAILGGPVGALAGGMVGAGVITTHLLVSHPQATLEAGTAMIFTLTEPLQMASARAVRSSDN